MDNLNPTLYGTQKDYAWDAWQKAFDAGTLLPDHDKFEKWWNDVALPTQWKSTKEMMDNAWGMGVHDRYEQCLAGFNAWWQQILDSAPKP